MSGIWLASYLVMWVVVAVLSLAMVGVLRQLGLLQSQFTQDAGQGVMPPLEMDGPAIGSEMPEFVADSVNGFGPVAPATGRGDGQTLLVFMSPLCDSCQDAVDPLNLLGADVQRNIQLIVIMRADVEACQRFVKAFALHLPVVPDSERELTTTLGVQRNPFGLLYSNQHQLIRKGMVWDSETLSALLGDQPTSDRARRHVFPQLDALTNQAFPAQTMR